MNLVVKRILAFCIDYVLIIILGSLIFVITSIFGIEELIALQAQLVGFLTLTLPVFLYFYLSESSRKQATIGKRLLKIKVDKNSNSQKKSVFTRNFFKFLPWEIAHAGVHWVFYYSSQQLEIPFWIWLLLILPQVLVIIYIISIIASKGKSSLYDTMGGTVILKT